MVRGCRSIKYPDKVFDVMGHQWYIYTYKYRLYFTFNFILTIIIIDYIYLWISDIRFDMFLITLSLLQGLVELKSKKCLRNIAIHISFGKAHHHLHGHSINCFSVSNCFKTSYDTFSSLLNHF